MNWLIAFLLAVYGFAALSLSMKKHQRAVFGAIQSKTRSRTYRLLGAGLITASTAWCVYAFNWAIGIVVICAITTYAAILIAMLLTLRPKSVRYLCWLPGCSNSCPEQKKSMSVKPSVFP